MKYNISVVVPAYNEEENLKKAVNDIIFVLKEVCNKYEIIIVESGSTDRTPEIADEICKKNKNIGVIHQKERYGFGNGLREGYDNCKLDLVWYFDPDCPYNVEELKKALPLIRNADAVIGYKTGKRESFMRAFLSVGYNFLIKLIFRLKVKDINFSFKLLRKEALDKLDLKSDGWFIDSEILIELKKKKCKINQIGIHYNIRKKGKSKIENYPKIILGFLKEMLEYGFYKNHP